VPRNPKPVVRLTAEDRGRLARMVRSGQSPARAVTHARVLLTHLVRDRPKLGRFLICPVVRRPYSPRQ
jgi:hypothetical protein